MTEVFIKRPHQDRSLYKNEKKILEALPAHPGLPKIIGYSDRDGKIILEKINGLTLYQFRENQRRQYLKCLEIVTGITAVVTVLHQQGIVHNELSDRNIMLRGRKRAPVIIDFQDAFRLGVQYKSERSLRGTSFYMAPEKYSIERPYSCLKSEIYSLGAVIFYTITGSHNREALLTNQNYPQALRNLVAQCLSLYPRKRPTAEVLLRKLEHLRK